MKYFGPNQLSSHLQDQQIHLLPETKEASKIGKTKIKYSVAESSPIKKILMYKIFQPKEVILENKIKQKDSKMLRHKANLRLTVVSIMKIHLKNPQQLMT